MSNKGTLTLTSGLVSARIPDDAWIDAGTANYLAGVEFAVESASVSIGTNDKQRAPVMLGIACTPATLMRLALEILRALGAPAFTDPEWLTIADACEQAGLGELAERINAGRANAAGGPEATFDVTINVTHADGTLTVEYEHRRVAQHDLGRVVASAMAKAQRDYPPVGGAKVALDLTITNGDSDG